MTPEIPSNVPIDDSPADRMTAAVGLYGEKWVAERAMSLLEGGNEGDEFLLWVGGRHAQGVLNGAPPLYWPEVWGARALSYVWDDSAAPSVVRGLRDRAWRVREMCAKVALQRGVGTPAVLAPLLTDENARVRAAGARAIAELGGPDNAEALRSMLRDPEKDVRRAAQQSLARLTERLELPES
jgi:hypothetical protein